ncbi:MAG: hypothetical protein ACE37K_03380 [Planctomycetota bacterium]
MDIGEFAQENKPWLVGCAIGAVVWLIGSAVIDSVTGPGATPRQQDRLRDAYNREALSIAQDENEKLGAERERLTKELAFEVAPKFRQWTGTADTHLFQTGRDLRLQIVNAASDRDVLVEESDISWEVPSGIDQIRDTLFGLDLIDAAQQRLFAAHDRVVKENEDAQGLSAIAFVKLESNRGRRTIGRGRGRRRGGVDISELIKQQRVNLQFQCDEATLAYFLESCRKPGRTLVLDRLTVTEAARPGEPITVKATLSGIAFVKQEEDA